MSTLLDEIVSSYERVKKRLKAEQDRRAVSRDTMPFQYANGRIMFGPERTKELLRDFAVHGDIGPAHTRIADEMFGRKELSSLTVGLARNTKMERVFVFVYLQE